MGDATLGTERGRIWSLLGAHGLAAGLFPGHVQASVAGNLGVLKALLEGGTPT
jgi:hypothetical protein